VEHPLVPVMRFYLVCIIAMAVACYAPAECSLLVLGSGFGWWKGCGCCSSTCGLCTTDFKTQYQIVVSGITSTGGCACTNYNGTWTVTKSTSIPTSTEVATGDCYAEFQINPCLCVVNFLGADYQADGKFAANRIVLIVQTTPHGGLLLVDFWANSVGTDCHVLENGSAPSIVWSWKNSSPSTDCAAYSSLTATFLGGTNDCGGGLSSTASVTAI